jgi:formylglycine-generating enzyme required for sulfatase activity
VIGIDGYQSTDVPALTGAVRDAENVAAELRKQGFEVKVLLNEKATGVRIREVLGDEMPNRLGPEDRLLVFFAGHGVSTGEGDGAIGYLLPVDGSRAKPRSRGIPMTELAGWFNDYKCKHVMFVADACYSGLALSTRALGLSPAQSDYLREITRQPVRMIMTAGGKGQEANEWQGQGLFTRFFLEAIRGGADADRDGIVTSDEVAAYVKPNVTQTAMTYLRARQTPLVGRRGEGEFVFVTGRAAAPATLQMEMEPAARPSPRPRPKVTAPAAAVALARPAPVAAAPAPSSETAGSDGAPMVLIPAGEFTMGSNDGEANEKPPHRVSISAFYLDKYEVTFDLYDKFSDATGRAKPADQGWGRGSRPVINVTWDDAKAYCDWAGKRLPTEAEWEYACRAGSAGKWCFGDDEGRLGEYAWYEYAWYSMPGRTHPVGEKRANAFGLFDMHGNVWEWCADWYGSYSDGPSQDPPGPASGSGRVRRGGSWGVSAVRCRSALRSGNPPSAWSNASNAETAGTRFDTYGFRCASSAAVR